MVGFEEMRGELLERIEDLLKRKQYTALRDLLSDLAPADIASLFEDLDEDSIPRRRCSSNSIPTRRRCSFAAFRTLS